VRSTNVRTRPTVAGRAATTIVLPARLTMPDSQAAGSTVTRMSSMISSPVPKLNMPSSAEPPNSGDSAFSMSPTRWDGGTAS